MTEGLVDTTSNQAIAGTKTFSGPIQANSYITQTIGGIQSCWSTDATGPYLEAVGAYPLRFYTNSAERMRLDSSGNLLVGKTSATANGGDVQVSKGITFPATQVACSDANTLDDYEEGTWTPTYFGQTTAGTATYTGGRGGQYTKIGNQVTAWFSLTNLSCTGASGNMIVGGLPFVANMASGVRGSYSGCIRLYAVDVPTGLYNITICIDSGTSTQVNFVCSFDNAGWQLAQVNNTSGQYIEGYITYTV